MRCLFAAGLMCIWAARADACPPQPDRTFVRGMRAWGRHEPRMPIVAPRPSFFVHIGSDSRPGLPEFFRLDGTPIEVTRVAELHEWGTSSILQVELAIDAGVIFVRLPDAREPSAYFVDRHFAHRP